MKIPSKGPRTNNHLQLLDVYTQTKLDNTRCPNFPNDTYDTFDARVPCYLKMLQHGKSFK